MAAANAPTRHAVLLSDGRDAGESAADLESAVASARAAGVTFSTLGIGRDADPELLGRLAQIGRGRAYVAVDAGDLPRLTVEESEIVRARAERTGSFRAQRAGDGPQPLLAGVDVGALPTAPGLPGAAAAGVGRRRSRNPDGRSAAVRVAGRPRAGGGMEQRRRRGVGDGLAGRCRRASRWLRAVRWTARRRAPREPDAAAETDDATGRTVVTAEAVDDDGEPFDSAAASLVITATEGASTTAMANVGPAATRRW
ncbi:MAG: vWA domain-containing protein [Anaerolineae bacterium]